MAQGQEDLRAQEPGNDERGRSLHALQAWNTLTLETPCECGHSRKSHRGLQMNAAGPCLECGCEQFKRLSPEPVPYEHVIEAVGAGLAQLEQLHELLATLRRQLEPAEDPRRRRRIALASRRSRQHGH
jgi:hypothetical protein